MSATNRDVLNDPVTNADLIRVEDAIREATAVNYPVMTDLLNGIIAAKGKMLRPRIILTAARMFDYDLTHLVPAAAGIELLHIASLIHDDTVDKALFRRGAATLNSVLPTTIVVLLGDYLFAQSAVLVSKSNNLRAMTLFAQSLGAICNGELDEIFQTRQWDQTRQEYERRIHGKTAALFATAAEFGGILSGAPDAAVTSLRAYGTAIGMGFQIVDDVLDLRQTSEEIGKPAGSDLRQGTLTLPMMLFLERYAGAADRELVHKIVIGTKTDDAAIDALVGRVRTSGALDDAIAEAQAAVDSAKRYLEPLPAGEARDYLTAMADFVTARRS